MNKKIWIFIIILIAILRIILMFTFDDGSYYEEEKNVIGKVTYIKKEDDKTTIDIKEKQKYRITIYDSVSFEYGDELQVTGLFKTPSDNTVFNLFNYRKYLLSKNIKQICTDCNVKIVSKNKNIFYFVKNAIIKHVDNYKSNDYLRAFVIGDTSLISEGVKEAYSNTGISHLLAVSGTHVSVFLVIINFVFKKSKLKNIILFSFLFFFLFITGFVESLLRCFVFMLLSHINKRLKLKISSEVLLVLTASLLLITNPYLVYSVGFMFSVVITFFIILIRDKLKDKNYLSKTFIISLISFLASVPILIYNFFKINVLSILFNVIFVPLVSIIVFPLSLVTFIIPLLDELYFIIVNILEKWVLLFNNIRILSFVVAKPNIIIVCIYYLIIYLSVKVNKRWMIIYIIMLVININAKFLIINPEVTFLDVGQGDSTIVILPKGKTVLIDTGGNFLSDSSIVSNKTIPYLNSKGINKIDLLILTHGDYDHMGESVNLVNGFEVENVIFNNDEFNDLELELAKVLEEKNIPYHQGVNELVLGRQKIRFLNRNIYDNENDNSIVLYTEFNEIKLLLMADVGTKVEQDLLEKYNLKDIDVLKVGHHGSKTSSSKEFIDEVNPKYSIISVGKNNRYGHPNKETLDNLEDKNVYRTDQNGSIWFKKKNNKLKIKTCIKK